MSFNYLLFLSAILLIGVFFNGKRGRPHVNFSDDTKRQYLIQCGIVIFIMIAFRSRFNGSTDSVHYYDNWENLSLIAWDELDDFIEGSIMEPMYLYTVYFLTRIFKEPQFVFVFSGALISFSLCRFLYKNCDDVMLGAYLFATMGLFNFMVQGLRQAVAMSICLFAFEYAKERKPVRFALLVLLAVLYHKSAALFFIVYFLYGVKLNLRSVGVMSCVFIATVFASDNLISLGNDIFDRGYGNDAATGLGGLISVLIYALILIVSMLFGEVRGDDKKYSLFFYVTAFGMVTFISRYVGSSIMERVSFFFAFGQLIMIPAVLRVFRDKERQFLTIVVIFLATIFGMYKFSTTGLDPYNFMWQVSAY